MTIPEFLPVARGIPRLGNLQRLGLCLLLSVSISRGRALAAEVEAPEYELKANYIAKFPDFVKWPQAGGQITVGVLGEDPFRGALDKLLKVRHSKKLEDLKGCQIIFISNSERGNIPAILAALAGTNAMTVSDAEGFARQGGVLGFIMQGGKLRFEINMGAARRAGIKIDSGLLKLAPNVIDK
jgi:hypothetical protein